MKRIIWLLALLIAAVACKNSGSHDFDEASADPDVLKVMTFNVRYGSANDGDNAWKNRRKAAVEMILDQHPAVFGVQEALDFQLKYIASNTGYKHKGVGREDGKNSGEHMSVFYDPRRIELIQWGTYWLSETPDEPSLGWDAACKRTATWTLLKDRLSGREFFFVNTHLDHVGVEARRKGLALVVDRIGKMNPDGWPMILCGDFNVYPDDSCLTDLRGMMTDAWTSAAEADDGPTWHDWGRITEGDHIDYIFYKGFKSCSGIRRITSPYGNTQYVSDHYPVVAELEW